jgi:hypothetical protein
LSADSEMLNKCSTNAQQMLNKCSTLNAKS